MSDPMSREDRAHGRAVKKRLTEDAASFSREVEQVDATKALAELLARLGISPEHLAEAEPKRRSDADGGRDD